MDCPNINNLTFSSRSRDAIDEIRKVRSLGARLQSAMGGGTVLSIFAGNGVMKSTYMLTITDFHAMSEALSAVPSLVRKQIRDISYDTYERVSGYEEKQFWKAVAQGCRVK